MIKWDNKAKERLYKAIRSKMEQKNWVRKDWRDLRDRPHALLTRFLDKFGVVQVQRGCRQDNFRQVLWKGQRLLLSDEVWHWTEGFPKGEFKSRKHVIIPHPNHGPELSPEFLSQNMLSSRGFRGLAIPKDVAEKFLVLGIP